MTGAGWEMPVGRRVESWGESKQIKRNRGPGRLVCVATYQVLQEPNEGFCNAVYIEIVWKNIPRVQCLPNQLWGVE